MDQYFEPFEVLVGIFDGKDKAKAALKEIKHQARVKKARLENSAVISKSEDGKVAFHEMEDVGTRRGAIFGAIAGGIFGLVGGPLGAAIGAVAGAAAGGVAAGKLDMGFEEKTLQELQTALGKDSSAVLLVVERQWADEMVQSLEARGARIFRQVLTTEIARILRDENSSPD
jgi:uncharacterized membrane protein